MDYILVPNLIHFAALYPYRKFPRDVAGMFDGFSPLKLRTIRFFKTPLIPLLTSYDFPLMFPQLESVMLIRCTDGAAFIRLLEPPSSKNELKYLLDPQRVDNPFPKLEELVIWDMTSWALLRGVVEKRLKNGDKSLRKICLPGWGDPSVDASMPHAAEWLPEP